MIGQHPDLADLPELKLFCCPTVGELEASLPAFWKQRGVVHRSPGLVRAVAQYVFGGQGAASLGEAQSWLRAREHWPGADVLDVLLERLHPRTAIEKSPDNVFTDAALTRMAVSYPRARYIHLTRHPLTTQRSMQAHRERAIGVRARQGEPMSGIASWYEIHRRILSFAADLPVGRYLRVRAEDVLNGGATELTAIAAWLGVGADAAALDAMAHPERSLFAHPVAAGDGSLGGHDPGFLDDPVPRRVELPRSLEAPTGWAAEPGVWPLVADLAIELGYGTAS